MQIARVVGSVWATRKLPDLKGLKFLILQPMEMKTDTEVGEWVIAADTQHAGKGDLVYYVTSKEASFPFKKNHTALDAAVMGHVDRVDL